MPCVLIVEDDPDACEFMSFLMSANGYETVRARNGREALELMRKRMPCIVLLDLHMPVMDGWEFRRRQLLDPKAAGVPVVAVTAHFDPRAVTDTLGVKCLHKPIHIEDVVREVEFACGAGQAV